MAVIGCDKNQADDTILLQNIDFLQVQDWLSVTLKMVSTFEIYNKNRMISPVCIQIICGCTVKMSV